MSLRRRVLLGVAVVVVVLVVSNAVLASTFEGYLIGRVDEQLADTIERPVVSRRAQLGPRRADETLTDLFLGIADLEAGTVVRLGAGLSDAPPPALTTGDLVERSTRAGTTLAPFTAASIDGETRWRVVAVGIGRDVLVVGIDLGDTDAALARARRIQLAGSAAVLVALAAVAWWVLRLGVRPLVEMAAAADEIAAGDLDRRVEPGDESTEAGRLARALNTMLGEIQRAFDQRAASEAKVRQFAADASHELRTPLTSIRGYAELWQAGGLRGSDQLDEAMRRMAEEANRMQALVDDLMLLARLDQDRALERAAVALDDLVADAVRDARAVEPERPITVEAGQVVVEGDEHALRQLIGNLLTNALAHTPAGTPVRVVLDEVGDRARLTVADEGAGIPAEVADRVFERFVRADPARARSGRTGSGLGLSIVRSVAECHGGTARLEPHSGPGATFVVELPTTMSDLAAGSQPPPS